jgi:ubiquinone/menaquinone biosynthesis C-methylase UbiE
MDARKTRATEARYDRLAPVYDLMETFAERVYQSWRERAWSLVEGPEALEVGVGTGKNFPYHPDDIRVMGVDLSDKMLARARRQVERLKRGPALRQMDVQTLEFDADAFDCAVATFVFCSVPDAVLGLEEVSRVVKPGGQVILLEHMRADNPLLGALMDFFDPIVVRLMGPHINRETIENVRRAGLEIERVEDLDRLGIFKLIVARASEESPTVQMFEGRGSDTGQAD